MSTFFFKVREQN